MNTERVVQAHSPVKDWLEFNDLLSRLKSSTFYPMPSQLVLRTLFLAVAVVVSSLTVVSQTKPVPKTLFYDSDGNLISNNEFVDIRMANPHYPDQTIMKTLDDGTVVFRLQKVPQEGAPAPAFSVRMLDGTTRSLDDLKGKVVVLSFWFIGCPSCKSMEPRLNEFKGKFADRDDIVFLAMTADPATDVKKYLAKERFDYAHAAGARDAMESFVFKIYPKNIVIDRSGKIVYWRSTIKAWDKFESVVRGELAKQLVGATNNVSP